MPTLSPSFPAACLLSLPLHCMQNPEPEPLCEQDLHCATPTLLSISSCSMPAQPATALQCSADPLSAQAGTPGDQERAFAAVAAANRRGGGSESVLDALEAAESQSQAAPAQGGQDASTASAQGQQGGISPGVMHAVRADACQPPPPACSGVQFPLAAPPPPPPPPLQWDSSGESHHVRPHHLLDQGAWVVGKRLDLLCSSGMAAWGAVQPLSRRPVCAFTRGVR